MEKQGSLFYVVWITALIVFFSPFVIIYLTLKAANKIAVLFKSRVRKAGVEDHMSVQADVTNIRV
jgi:hypothetical protein